MATKYMYVEKGKTQGAWRVCADGCLPTWHFFMSRRAAIKQYRRDNGLVGKHFCIIEF